MTATGLMVMAENHQQRLGPRKRLGAFLRAMYPSPGRDKRLASDLEVSQRTARNLFEDHWPGDDTFEKIVARFGNDVLRVLCASAIEPVLAELTEREARLVQELEGIRARRRQVAGSVDGGPCRLAGVLEAAPGLSGDPITYLADARPGRRAGPHETRASG